MAALYAVEHDYQGIFTRRWSYMCIDWVELEQLWFVQVCPVIQQQQTMSEIFGPGDLSVLYALNCLDTARHSQVLHFQMKCLHWAFMEKHECVFVWMLVCVCVSVCLSRLGTWARVCMKWISDGGPSYFSVTTDTVSWTEVLKCATIPRHCREVWTVCCWLTDQSDQASLFSNVLVRICYVLTKIINSNLVTESRASPLIYTVIILLGSDAF